MKPVSCLLLAFTAISPLFITASRVEAISADHTVVAAFPTIPESVILQIRSQEKIFYGHTSHGSQVVTGMGMIRSENSLYDFNNGSGTLTISEYGTDLGANGDTTWVTITRQQLNQPGNGITIVVWSWCGQVSGNSAEAIDIYLNAMTDLEQDYPGVQFIYMTGHLDGTGPTGNLYLRNNQIRAYCVSHGKALFDFADIESYAPDGTYYPDGSDACEWCYDWCNVQSCPTCGDCAHSHCFNCYQKGKAFWWLMARLTGWTEGPCCEGTRGNVNATGIVDGGDLSGLVSYLTGGGFVLPCAEEANVDGGGIIDSADLALLISHLTGGGAVLPSCP